MLEVCRIPARWGNFFLSGLIFLIIGIICLIFTRQILNVILIIFSAIALVIGILLVVSSLFVVGLRMQWAPLLFTGIIFIVIGLVSVYFPSIVIAISIFLIAGLSFLIGLLMLMYGAISFAEMKTRIIIVALGIIPMAIGIYIILNPESAGSLVLGLWGIFACIIGIVFIAQAIILRNVQYQLGCDE
jgi:uncharacterized membrane protein HdeD (DUF308 family)